MDNSRERQYVTKDGVAASSCQFGDDATPTLVVEDELIRTDAPIPDFDSTTGQRHDELALKTTRGIAWTVGSRLLQQGLQFAVIAVLARLLTPSDFGLVGLIAVFTGFATLLTDFGLSAALIQRPDVNHDHLSSAFWLNLVSGGCLSLLFAAGAPLIALFYGEPSLVWLTMVSGLVFLLNSTAAVQSSLLDRRMDFRRIALIENLATIVAAAAAIGAAAAGAGVWSLIVLTLAAAAARSAILWGTGQWRPQLRISRPALRDLWGFSVNLAAFNTTNYWARNADNLLIGKVLGPGPLGIYTRAYSTMLLPMSQVGSVAMRVMFPALSRIQDDKERVRRIYLRSVGLIALVTFPIAVGLFVAARPFVLTFYGSRWSAAVPILRLLCIVGLIQSIATTVGLLYQSQGRTDWMFRWSLLSTGMVIGAFAIGVQWGLTGVAISYVTSTMLLSYFSYAIPGRLIGMQFREVPLAIWRPLLASALMGLVVWGAAFALTGWPWAAQLGAEIALGMVGYLFSVTLVARALARDLLSLLRRLA